MTHKWYSQNQSQVVHEAFVTPSHFSFSFWKFILNSPSLNRNVWISAHNPSSIRRVLLDAFFCVSKPWRKQLNASPNFAGFVESMWLCSFASCAAAASNPSRLSTRCVYRALAASLSKATSLWGPQTRLSAQVFLFVPLMVCHCCWCYFVHWKCKHCFTAQLWHMTSWAMMT